MIKRTSHSWVYKHRISLGVVAFILIACITLLFLTTSAANRDIEANTNKIAELNARYDKLLPELKTMRDARLAKEAADKAAEEAAAAKAAEQAKAATTATPATPAASSCRLSTNGHSNPNNIDILVNKTHCLSPLDFAPIDLVSVNGYLVSAKAAPHLRDMLAAAAAQGLTMSLTSSYRSYANQITTYNGWVATNGSAEAADTVSARPGYSEHQTGLAVDLGTSGCALECFAGTPHYAWLQQNAASYGFIQRYHAGHEGTTGYSPEAWHYRYVGSQIALDMQKKGIKTLEQYWGISGGDYPR